MCECVDIDHVMLWPSCPDWWRGVEQATAVNILPYGWDMLQSHGSYVPRLHTVATFTVPTQLMLTSTKMSLHVGAMWAAGEHKNCHWTASATLWLRTFFWCWKCVMILKMNMVHAEEMAEPFSCAIEVSTTVLWSRLASVKSKLLSVNIALYQSESENVNMITLSL